MTPTPRSLASIGMFLLFSLATGCASYTAPGQAANFRELGASPDDKAIYGDAGINAQFKKKPLAGFPANIATIRVQGPQYQSHTYRGRGDGGRFTVVTNREAEKDEQFQRLLKMPLVAGVAPVNRMLLTGPCNSEEDLRKIAARLQADMLLVYTFDTQFYVKDFAKPVTVVTLDLSPNRAAKVTTTASALLMDTRSGYIYGLAEASAQSSQLTNAWSDEDTIDDTRRRTEAESFEKLVGEVEKSWKGVVDQYAKPVQAVR